MPTYVTLQSFTERGIKEIKDIHTRDAELIKRLEALGIKVTAYYLVMGEYDEVVIWEAPSEEVAVAWLLELGARGYRRSVTLPAFNNEQFEQALKGLP